MKVREKLFALFGEYVSNIPTPSTSSGIVGQATQETKEQYANEGSLSMMQVCYFFKKKNYLMIFIFFLD